MENVKTWNEILALWNSEAKCSLPSLCPTFHSVVLDKQQLKIHHQKIQKCPV